MIDNVDNEYRYPYIQVSEICLQHYKKIRIIAVAPIIFLFFFFFIFKLYKIVLVLPNIEMNPPQVYICSPS